MRSQRAIDRKPSPRMSEQQREGVRRPAPGPSTAIAPPPTPVQAHATAPAGPSVGHTFGALSLFPAVPTTDSTSVAPASLQRLGEGRPAGAAADLGARIRAAAGTGGALPAGVQRRLEAGLGADLSGVRLHTDGEADRLSRAVHATAFTTGPDIFFRAGAYQPGTSAGLHVLAHEAAHVVQQAAGPVAGTPAPGGVSISDPGDVFERAADGAAAAVLQRAAVAGYRPVPVGHVTAATVVQRGKESQALLAEMAAQTFAGPEVEVQDQIVATLDKKLDAAILQYTADKERLEKAYDETPVPELSDKVAYEEREALLREANRLRRLAAQYNNVSFIGAIVISRPLGASVEQLIMSSKLVDLPNVTSKDGGPTHSLDASSYHLIEQAGLKNMVVRNTLRTMEAARQLDYLRESGLIGDDYVILIEVHYYRSRDVGATKFHKDTRGQTLFVNLNFTNTEEILGPEVIINPASDPVYDEYVRGHLPGVFVDDLNAVKDTLRGQKHIHNTKVEPKGVVAFVDEAIHHKTPTPRQRTASGAAIAKALHGIYGGAYDDAARAYKEYKGASTFSPWPWSTYLKDPSARRNAGAWYAVIEKIEAMKLSFQEENRIQLAASLPPYFHGDIDAIVEEGGSNDFGDVVYSHVKDATSKNLKVPVKKPGERPLKRTMSTSDLSQYAVTSGVSKKRTFFRTWVRAVPRKDFGL